MKGCWENFKFHPKQTRKIQWDILVIILSVWNSILIPFEFAFEETVAASMGLTVFDYIVDVFFAFDILINFRTMYIDPKSEAIVSDGKLIAAQYLSGRFWVDLLASMPFELVALIL